MANNFATAFESAEKVGTPVDNFSGDVRALGATYLDETDIFRIPADFKVFKHNDLSKTAGKDVCFTVAEILDNNGNVVSGKNLFPGMFNRTVYEWSKDEFGNLQNAHKVHIPKGEPVDDFNGESTIQEAMKKVAGKKIRVKKVDIFNTRNFTRDDLQSQRVYTLEYVN